jgi:hypothetical protein
MLPEPVFRSPPLLAPERPPPWVSTSSVQVRQFTDGSLSRVSGPYLTGSRPAGDAMLVTDQRKARADAGGFRCLGRVAAARQLPLPPIELTFIQLAPAAELSVRQSATRRLVNDRLPTARSLHILPGRLHQHLLDLSAPHTGRADLQSLRSMLPRFRKGEMGSPDCEGLSSAARARAQHAPVASPDAAIFCMELGFRSAVKAEDASLSFQSCRGEHTVNTHSETFGNCRANGGDHSFRHRWMGASATASSSASSASAQSSRVMS